MTKPLGNSDGFTLIEVLVALVILALAAGFAFKTVSGSFAWLSQAGQEQQAIAAAETALARLGHELSVKPGRQAGSDGDLHWRIEIGSALAEPPPVDALAVYPVTVEVEWRDGSVARQFQLKTVLMGPELNTL